MSYKMYLPAFKIGDVVRITDNFEDLGILYKDTAGKTAYTPVTPKIMEALKSAPFVKDDMDAEFKDMCFIDEKVVEPWRINVEDRFKVVQYFINPVIAPSNDVSSADQYLVMLESLTHPGQTFLLEEYFIELVDLPEDPEAE